MWKLLKLIIVEANEVECWIVKTFTYNICLLYWSSCVQTSAGTDFSLTDFISTFHLDMNCSYTSCSYADHAYQVPVWIINQLCIISTIHHISTIHFIGSPKYLWISVTSIYISVTLSGIRQLFVFYQLQLFLSPFL